MIWDRKRGLRVASAFLTVSILIQFAVTIFMAEQIAAASTDFSWSAIVIRATIAALAFGFIFGLRFAKK